MLTVALDDKHIEELDEYRVALDSFGLESCLLYGEELEREIKSPLFVAGLTQPQGAILNPAKLVRGMKQIVEQNDIEIFERTVVTRITPGVVHHVDTELGDIRAPDLVLAVNAYAHKLGFFQNRVFPVSVYQIVTERLSESQWESIGWRKRQGLSDKRIMYSYSIPTADGRILMGGRDYTYYHNDALSSGNDKTVTKLVRDNLFAFFPQLEGLRIEHSWGGTNAFTIGKVPAVGVIGDHENIFYGFGISEGVPTTQTFGRIIADLMAGKSNEFTNHFIVNRKLPYVGPKSLRSLFGKGAKWMIENLGFSPIH